METEDTAANTTEEVVENANSEQVESVETEAIESTEAQETAQETPQEPKEEEITKTQAFARRLKEETARVEQTARDKMISEMYGQSHNIHTYADYQKAVEQQAEADRKAALQEKGIDPSIVDEYVSNNPVVRKAAELIKQQEAQQKQTAQYGEFLNYFKQENDRDFNPATDKIPQEVWEQTAKGKSLADAYAHHDNKQLRAKLKAFETNTKNASSSPGSVTGNGTPVAGHISYETFEANKHDQSWVNKNFTKINESRKKW